jgi:ABC-type lipoprotein release transport system permease subunit
MNATALLLNVIGWGLTLGLGALALLCAAGLCDYLVGRLTRDPGLRGLSLGGYVKHAAENLGTGWRVALSFPLVGALVVLLLLQAAGLVRRVPFSYNLRNLLVRWRITLLTALAFTLVVGLMTVMLAFVNGMYKLTEGSGQPGNVIVLADGATDELFSNLGFGDITEVALRDEVARDEEGRRLVSWEVYVVVNQPIPTRKCPKCGRPVAVDQIEVKLAEHGDPPCPGSGLVVKGGRQRRFIQVRGIEDPVCSALAHGMELHPGGAWFSSAGIQALPGGHGEQAVQAVIGEGLARELGPDQGKPALEVGDVFELGPRKWVVVGIMKSAGSTFDSEVWAKHQLAGDLFGKKSYTTVVLRTSDAETARALAADLTANYRKPAVQAQTEPEYYEKLNTTNQQFLVSILIVVAIMAVGGVFGVMNTMFAAISQRTKDIGVLRILGFAPWQVLASFFLESLLLALLGGALGCALGSLADGWTASSIASSGAGGGKSVMLRLVVDGDILTAGLLFSLLMGAVGGLLPALSAMRLKPLESLR